MIANTEPVKSKTIVYVDGFNLYYGALYGTGYKWLDIQRVCNLILTKNDVVKIRYFTARISARPGDPTQPIRQETYLRALKTVPNLEIHFGHFLSHAKRMPLATPPQVGSKTAMVISTQEKGSDVNLASYLLLDAFQGHFETAVVISNDSDLATPVRMVKEQFGKKVGIINPHSENTNSQRSRELSKHAHFYKPLLVSTLQRCQFPTVITDSKGTIHKPQIW